MNIKTLAVRCKLDVKKKHVCLSMYFDKMKSRIFTFKTNN